MSKTFTIFAEKRHDDTMKEKILFVCLGNICRSPAAEGIMKHIVEERGIAHLFLIDSCGIGAWHVGQLPDSRMRRHGHDHGYRFDHRARQITKADFDLFDHIVVMDRDNLRAVNSLAPNAAARAKGKLMANYLRHHDNYDVVPDPYYGTDRDFELVIELLEDACEGLMEEMI